jgi:hypothetical protein
MLNLKTHDSCYWIGRKLMTHVIGSEARQIGKSQSPVLNRLDVEG